MKLTTNVVYRLAVICWAVPFLLGCSVFALWQWTRAGFLEVLGIYAVLGGLALLPCGAIALFKYRALAVESPAITGRTRQRKSLLCGALLLSNLPLAAWIMITVSALQTLNTVVVRNHSQWPVEEVSLQGGGLQQPLGPIEAGREIHHPFHIESEGELFIHARHRGASYSESLGYVTPALNGADYVIAVDSDGVLTVDWQRR